MLTRPLIVGSKGNMARRYAAIFKHLGVDYVGIDQGDAAPIKGTFDSILLCTPTWRHIDDIFFSMGAAVPVLCEKPIGTNLTSVLDLCDMAQTSGLALRMVNQYAHINIKSEGLTSYSYYNSGKDGLVHDCISLVALARGDIRLSNISPIWKCTLNGTRLSPAVMDHAYIAMIEDWLRGNVSDIPYIRSAHQKVHAYIEREL